MNVKATLVVLLVIISSVLIAQNSLILEVSIQGNSNIKTDLIQSLITLEVGDYLSGDNVAKTYKNLNQLGVFKDISINSEDIAQGVRITINVTEFPIVNEVKIKGNDKLSNSKILEVTNLKYGSYWSPFSEVEIREKIADEYVKKGYHLVQTEFETKTLDNNYVDVIINIDEGNKVVIKSINIHGNKDVSTKKIRGIMRTKKASLLRSGKYDEEKFEEDLQRIVDYYNKKGYIDAQVKSSEVNLKNGNYAIDIYLFEGKSYFFGSVSVEGNKRFNDESIISNFRFKENEKFNLEKFNKQLSSVASMYYEEGFIYSNFDHELEKKGDRIDVKLKITENTRAKVRKINIVGNRRTKEKVIRRHLSISPGDYFRQSKVIQTQQNIYNMGLFEADLYPTFDQINTNGDIDLTVHVSDRVSGSANGGVSMNSSDGIYGQLALDHKNLFGNAWQAGVQWEFGKSVQNFRLNFTNPYFMDSNVLMGFDVYHTQKEYTTYELYTNGGTIRTGTPLTFLNFSKLVFGYSYYQKKYRILDDVDVDDVSSSLVSLDATGWQTTSSISATLTRDSRDNVFFPTSGSNITVFNELAGGPLQGDFDYYKQILQVSWYTKTIWELTLRTKWRFGYVEGYNGKEVPPDERFYLGGTGPDGIRGYTDNSIGPTEGGLREVIFSTEYSAPIAGDTVVGLLFFDAGNSYNKLERFNFWEMKKGAGAGLRVRSPMGLIGFDYAYNFETDTWEPHFQMGTTF
ncbi:MAG: outer membrane protein assembly factor BamA [Candidatus Cloacimonetes bacterium]|nr:outer membrane protein assembly factor BamA [Candidatus Cloacimonadota bacterium]